MKEPLSDEQLKMMQETVAMGFGLGLCHAEAQQFVDELVALRAQLAAVTQECDDREETLQIMRDEQWALNERAREIIDQLAVVAQECRKVGHESVTLLVESFCELVNERLSLREQVVQAQATVSKMREALILLLRRYAPGFSDVIKNQLPEVQRAQQALRQEGEP